MEQRPGPWRVRPSDSRACAHVVPRQVWYDPGMEADASTDHDAAWAPSMITDRSPDMALPPPMTAAAPAPLRVQFPFAVLIRWQDRTGRRCEFRTVLDVLTPTEVELRLEQPILGRRRPLLVVQLAREATDSALRLAFLGTVQRIEPCPDGRWSHTISFTHYRFLYPVCAGAES